MKQDELESDLKIFISDFEDTVIDSGTFQHFLYLTETKVDFRNFIEYGIYKDKLSEQTLTKEQFIKIVSSKAHIFIKSNRNPELPEIPIEILKDYFDVCIKGIDKHIIKSLDKNLRFNNYLLRIKMDEIVERITNKIVSQTNISEVDAEKIKSDYINILLAKYKSVHIYGIEDLNFNEFYIKPSFVVSITENKLSPIIKGSQSDREYIPLKWEDIFVYSNIVSIIGGAGFGKTLFLKNMIFDYTKLNVPESTEMVPIYCDLKKFSENIQKDMSYTIKNFLVDSMTYDTSLNELNIDFLNYCLNKGQCLILFDALDEVDSAQRINIHSLIVNFFQNVNKNNKVCITSRERGFIPKTNIVYKVKPVDKTVVIKYVDKLIKINKFKADYKENFVEECIKLINSRFLESFLMLSLLVNIYKAERRMPKNKIDLYKKSVEYIAKDREMGITEDDPKKSKFDFDLMESIISTDESFEQLSYLAKPNNKEVSEDQVKLAFIELHNVSYPCKNDTQRAIKEFLRFCSERTELFIKSGEKSYKFYHKSFFEYFYSKYMLNNLSFTEICNEMSEFDFTQEIPSMVIELMRDSHYSQYKKFINFVISSIKDGSLDFIETLSILVQVDEPGFLLELSDLFINSINLANLNFSINTKNNFEIEDALKNIRNQMLLSQIIYTLFVSKKIITKKTIRSAILSLYKADYLLALYNDYIMNIKINASNTKNSSFPKPSKYTLPNLSIDGLILLASRIGNIFRPRDFKKQELENLLASIDIIKNEDELPITTEEQTSLIQDFYQNVYSKFDCIYDTASNAVEKILV